jgi:peptidyl-prolyl cis-trans isomerase C
MKKMQNNNLFGRGRTWAGGLPALARTKSGRIRLLAAVAVVIAIVAASAFVIQSQRGLPGGVAARVGDTSVTNEEVQSRMQVLRALYGINPPKGKKKADTFRRDSAKAVAVSVVLDHAAESRDIVIAEKSARDTLTKMIDTQLPDGRKSFIELLRTYGASEDDVIAEIMRQQRVDRLFQEITKDSAASVTEADVQAYFNKNKVSLVQPQQRSIQNLVVTDEKQAATLHRRAVAGENFTALVAKYSLDESTRSENGKLGFVSKAQLEDAYAEPAFAARVGSVFGPVKTEHGWNVGRVIASKVATDLKFADVKAELVTRLRYEKAYGTWRKWLAKEIKRTDVTYSDAYRPADPDSPPPVPDLPALGSTAGSSTPAPGSP